MTRVLSIVGVFVAAGVATAYPPPPKVVPEPRLPPPTQADWQKSVNNLKLIGVACHNYHDATGAFPADVTDAAGKPLLSWRVQILPYMEQEDLFKKFKPDEAWDGPTNKPLVEKLPTVFAPVRVKTKQPGLTFYQGFAGPGAMFDPDNRRIRATAVADGLSNTALVAEAAVAVEWTKPADLAFDPSKALPLLGGHFDGEFNLLMCDGSVTKVKKDFDAATMKAVVTRNGGEVYSLDGVKK
jgi:Protein of unknown function (DUF1559)